MSTEKVDPWVQMASDIYRLVAEMHHFLERDLIQPHPMATPMERENIEGLFKAISEDTLKFADRFQYDDEGIGEELH